MAQSDASPRIGDLGVALGLLSRWPVPAGTEADPERAPALAAWAFPLVGLWIGIAAAILAWVSGLFGAPDPLVAGLALAALIAQTGGLHEDGLADCADGFWGASTREDRLRIMKDSRTGAFGALALALTTVVRFALLVELARVGGMAAALCTAAALSRVPMALGMAWLDNARGHGLSASVGKPPRQTAMLAIAVGVAVAFVTGGFAVVPSAIWLAAAATAVLLIARAKIGGQTGDVLGAVQVVGEIAVLSALLSAWT